jgi:hypothetical protein
VTVDFAVKTREVVEGGAGGKEMLDDPEGESVLLVSHTRGTLFGKGQTLQHTVWRSSHFILPLMFGLTSLTMFRCLWRDKVSRYGEDLLRVTQTLPMSFGRGEVGLVMVAEGDGGLTSTPWQWIAVPEGPDHGPLWMCLDLR